MPPSSPTPSTTPGKAPTKSANRTAAIAAAGALGAIAAGVFGALKLGWLDRALTRARGNAEHPVPDLAAGAPTPGTTRAPDACRPDPTAAIPASEREALSPPPGRPVLPSETD